MGYRRDRGGRKTRRLMVATALSVAPVIHGCVDGGGNVVGNPKGDFYDRGLVDDAAVDAEIDYLVISNPKGSFFDEGLVEPDGSTDGAAGADGGGDGDVDGGDGAVDGGDGAVDGGDGGVGDGYLEGDGTGGAGGR